MVSGFGKSLKVRATVTSPGTSNALGAGTTSTSCKAPHVPGWGSSLVGTLQADAAAAAQTSARSPARGA